MSACEEAASEGTPCNQAVIVVLIEMEILHLVFRTAQHVVLILSADRLMQVQSLADIQGIHDHLRIPVGSCPVQDLTRLDGLMEATADLLNGGDIILEVCVEDVHVVHLESLEGSLEAFLDMFAGDEVVGVDVRLGGNADLGGDHDFLPGDGQVLKDLAQLQFGFPCVIGLGGIEVVDAVFQGGLDDLLVHGVGLLLGVDHVSQGDHGGEEAGAAEVAVGHLAGLESD